MGAARYNSWRVVSLSPLPRWALILLALLLLAGFLWTGRSLWRERRRWRRSLLLCLRALSALCLLGLLIEPGLQRLQTARVKNRFVVLLDRSHSMALPADSANATGQLLSRGEVVARWAAAHLREFEDLGQRFQIELWGFSGGNTSGDGPGSELEPIDLSRLALSPKPRELSGARTDLLGALRTVESGGNKSHALAGILLISDGADNAQLQHPGDLEGNEKAQLKGLGVPVNTLAVGQEGLKDLAVASLQVDDFAFVRNPLTLEVTLRSEGFGREDVPVTLTRAGRVVASQTVTLNVSGTTTLNLTFTPDQTGEFVYTVSVPVFPGEAVLDNNKRAFVLKVIRDRVRVLLVCGHPSWDERFLRGLLRQDPNVDLVSFFILRDVRDNTHTTSENELSLIPFPTEEIFRTQLHSFDLVILQDFAYRPFSSGRSSLNVEGYFPDLKRYVQEGGSLLMIGGENSFGEGQYDQTELADVLPVAGINLPPVSEEFHAQITEAGRHHPVTQLAESGELSEKIWASLPAVPGLNLVRPKPGAHVLLVHPLLSIGDQSAPLLVVADEGRGRSMALMTDSAWRWSFQAAGLGIGNRYYERFFTNAVHWLVRDPDLTPVKLSTPQRSIDPGQTAVFDVHARQADYGPAAGAQLTLTLLDAETDKQVTQLRATTARDGSARVEVPGLPAGAYRAVAEAQLGGVVLGKAEQALAVRESGPETEDPLAHPKLLARIALVTGGISSALGDGFPRLKTVHETEEVEIGRRKEEPLWDHAAPLVLLALLLGTEWTLRRRWGFA